MISIYIENDKSIFEIVSSVLADTEIVNKADMSDAVCDCDSKGNLSYYCKYSRTVTYIKEIIVTVKLLELNRYKCDVCGKTHLVVPGIHVIPYGRYTLGFILCVLLAYVRREDTVRGIAECYNISISTIYAWKRRFIELLPLLTSVLEAEEKEPEEAVKDVYQNKIVSVMLYEFVLVHHFGFMQESRKRKRPYIFSLIGYFIPLSRGSP
jgi:transposase-like protein